MINFKHRTKKENIILLTLFFILAISVIFLITSKSSQNNLKTYSSSNTISSWYNDSTVIKEDDFSLVKNTDAGYSVMIPKGWTETSIENGSSYLHEASQSTLSIETLDYYPSINNENASSSSLKVVEKGYTFLSFNRFSNSGLQFLYQDTNGLVNDYIETYFWSRNHIVHITCNFLDKNYSGIIKTFSSVLSSFKWTTTDIVPNGYNLYYNDILKFEVGVPAGWSAKMNNNALIYLNADSSANMVMTAYVNNKPLTDFSSTDISKMLGGGRNNFMLKSCDIKASKVMANYTYVDAGKQIAGVQYILSDGKSHYYFSFDALPGKLNNAVPETCISLFRKFQDDSKDTSEK